MTVARVWLYAQRSAMPPEGAVGPTAAMSLGYSLSVGNARGRACLSLAGLPAMARKPLSRLRRQRRVGLVGRAS